MKLFGPGVAAFVTLVVLWPAVCMSSEDGPTTCQSAVFLDLPWGENADTWGIGVALGGALAVFVLLVLLGNLVQRKRQ